jgi:hypothetical protein
MLWVLQQVQVFYQAVITTLPVVVVEQLFHIQPIQQTLMVKVPVELVAVAQALLMEQQLELMEQQIQAAVAVVVATAALV